MSRRRVLICGGAGYIGSHTILCLLQAGYDVAVVDNYVNSSEEALNRVRQLVGGADINERLVNFNVNMCDPVESWEKVLEPYLPFSSCIHFAGLKAVGESVREPIMYYQNNLVATFNLLSYLTKVDCLSVVFSSSATVYGSAAVPITEDSPIGVGITNPYGRTKYMCEEILRDFKKSCEIKSSPCSIVILRYFNPIGNHPSGRIGEDPNGIPNNLMPFVAQVAVGKRAKLSIFGGDYDTKDGTGVRDYIHVMDLADAHTCSINYMLGNIGTTSPGDGFNKCSTFNIGTGIGYSVLEMVAAMTKACGHAIPYEIGARREGDIATCYADASRAEASLGWKATRNLDDMCTDLWAWQSTNPDGYSSK